MDKYKTGNLIKDARNKKGYTQSELGTLIGVTNKAISRWENGESFPDVGVLEELSNVLDLEIKDLITGEQGAEASDVVTEIARVAKLQEKERKKKLLIYTVVAVVIACLQVIGSMTFGRHAVLLMKAWIYYPVVAVITGFITFYIMKDRKESFAAYKCSKWMTIVSVILGIYIVAMTIISMFIAVKNAEPTNVGIIINAQLCISFWINSAGLIYSIYSYMRWNSRANTGILIMLFNIFVSVYISDLLHNMTSFDGMMRTVVIGFLATAIIIVISCFVAVSLKRRINSNKK